MKKNRQKSNYIQPQVRVIQIVLKNEILATSAHTFGSAEDPIRRGRFSIDRSRE